jgi:hypothetical protein
VDFLIEEEALLHDETLLDHGDDCQVPLCLHLRMLMDLPINGHPLDRQEVLRELSSRNP